jgi:eukaryotic-like serine/threonine-protein kinase
LAPDTGTKKKETGATEASVDSASTPDNKVSEHSQQRFGRYQLLHRLASGGMADLYLARLSGEEGFERIMAVKVIHSHLSEQPEFVKMFIDEARLASRISHPNVALTLDLGRVGATHFIAMEYVDGESITSLLRKTRPPIPYSMRIISDAAAGLHAAHELRGLDGQLLGVVHRDVSPANILIAYDGTAKVVDFGVARARGSLHTTSNSFKGKFGYMSPEQFSAPETIDRRTDIFALGVVLYEMTTWTRLFKCETEAATVEKVLFREIAPPTSLVPHYPPALEAIVMRALARDPGARYETAQQLHEELEQAIVAVGGPIPSSAIGKMMRQVFADRIVERRRLLEQSSPGASELALEIVSESSGSSSSMALRPSVVTFARKKRRAAILVGAAIGLAVAVGVTLWLLRRAPEPAPGSGTSLAIAKGTAKTAPPDAAVSAPGDLAPRLVTIRATALPASATITLAGRPMKNPLELQQPARAGTAELVIEAPGHRTQRFEVQLALGGNWTVGLVPERRTGPGTSPPRAPKKIDRKHFLENPYK